MLRLQAAQSIWAPATTGLTLANAATNTLTVVNIETLAGGTGDDVVALGNAVTGGAFDLGSGVDSLTLANTATNTITVVNIETLIGGTGSDQATLERCDHGAASSTWARAPTN